MHKGDTARYSVNECAAGRRQGETGDMKRKRKKGRNRTAGHIIVAEGCKKLLQITGICRLHTNGLIITCSS